MDSTVSTPHSASRADEQGVQCFCWCPCVQDGSGAAVESVGDLVEACLGVDAEVGAFGEVLPDEAVVGAPPACGGVSLLPLSQGEWG
jgi:hypothetical protein